MFGLSAGHLLVLGIIILLFGSRRLPELGSSVGQAIRAFKQSLEVGEVIKIPEPMSKPPHGDSKTVES